jgi:hypothetical protein
MTRPIRRKFIGYAARPTVPVAIHVPSAVQTSLEAAGHEVPKPVKGLMIIDTAANVSAIDYRVASELDLRPHTAIKFTTSSGQIVEAAAYAVRIVCGEYETGEDLLPVPEIDMQPVNRLTPSDGEVDRLLFERVVGLMGRDMLSRAYFHYCGPDKQFILEFPPRPWSITVKDRTFNVNRPYFRGMLRRLRVSR